MEVRLVPQRKAVACSLMENMKKRREINLVKKIHRSTHAPAEEMKALFNDARIATAKLDAACDMRWNINYQLSYFA